MSEIEADARFWDRTARTYAGSPIKDMAGYERTVARARELLRPADAVLELGCGTGTTALTLAPGVARYVGSDLSHEMIAIAREKAAAAQCRTLEFSVVGRDFASWPGGPFDAVLALNLLHLVPDRTAYLRHVHAIMKPGGLFISKTPCLDEISRLLRLVVPVARVFGKAPRVAFFKAPQLVADIAAAGFTIAEQARHGSTKKDARIFVVASKGQ